MQDEGLPPSPRPPITIYFTLFFLFKATQDDKNLGPRGRQLPHTGFMEGFLGETKAGKV
jgi:hypothetical protein